jgi:hypothetical protein
MPAMTPEQHRELERLIAEHGNKLTAQIILDAARSPDSPLYSLFEVDIVEVARQYRADYW